MKKILFVCSGNTCRSPMAEGIMKKFINEDPILNKNFTVESAGLSAINDEPVNPKAIEVLKELWNIDISNLKSKPLDNDLIKSSHMILTMTKNLSENLLFEFSLKRTKILTLKEYLRYNSSNLDIHDPYGQSKDVYISCAKEIYDCLLLFIEKIKEALVLT